MAFPLRAKRVEGRPSLDRLCGEKDWARRVNDQWRICSRWLEGGPADVEIVDYH